MTNLPLTTFQISQLSAQITGGDVKRSATREAAAKRFVKLATDKGLNAPADLLTESFEDATEILHRSLGSISISVILDGAEVTSVAVAGKLETLTAEVDAFAVDQSTTEAFRALCAAGDEADAAIASGAVVFDEDEIPAFLRNDRSAAIDILPEPAPVVVKPVKAEKPAKAPKASKAARVSPEAPADKSQPKEGSKNAIMLSMAAAKEGATEAEICEALGWKACLVTLRRVCEKAGYELVTQKQKGGKARYFAMR